MNTNIRQVAIILCTVMVLVSGVAGTVSGAGDTGVALSPTTDGITTGSSTTVDIVVTNTSEGVGAINVTVSISSGNIATITNASLDGSANTISVKTNAANTSATITGYGLNTNNSGRVVVGTVTVEGESGGDTDVGLDVHALGDESGTDYSVTSVTSTTISVSSSSDGGDGGGGDTTSPTATTTDEPTTTNQQTTTTTTTTTTSTNEPNTTTVVETTGSQAPGFGPLTAGVALIGALALLRSTRST